MDLWDRLGGLTGKTLETERGKKFTILAVDRDQPSRSIVIEPESTGVPRSIQRVSIDRAHSLGLGGSIRPIDVVKTDKNEFNSAYIATMLRTIHRR